MMKNSTEDLLFGKPILNGSGFVSDKHSIELRHEGLRFLTVLPDEAIDAKDQTLRLVDHESVQLVGEQTQLKKIKLVAPAPLSEGDWWLRPGPDLPDECMLVEGPLVRDEGRCTVEILCFGTTRLGPSMRVASARPMTKKENDLLMKVRETEALHSEGSRQLEEALSQTCLLYTSPSPRDATLSRMPSSA